VTRVEVAIHANANGQGERPLLKARAIAAKVASMIARRTFVTAAGGSIE
jgi:hypothetical protein